MWNTLEVVSLCIISYACVINGAAILENGHRNQKIKLSHLDFPFETVPSVPSKTHIIGDAFSPLDAWRNADETTKEKILSAFIQELPFLTEGLDGKEHILTDKRYQFGYMGSRGKRTQHGDISIENFLNMVRPGFQRALSPLSRMRAEHSPSPEMSNSKRQPDFGFHAVRG